MLPFPPDVPPVVIGLVAGSITIILTLFWVFGGFEEPAPSERATGVARICKSGDHIFRYPDGSLRTSWGYRLETTSPAEVCE